MNEFVAEETPPGTATLASRWSILKGFGRDAVAWIIPWAIAGVVLLAIPPVLESTALTVLLVIVAAVSCVIAVALDIRALKRNGCTDGLWRQGLRVVDREQDAVLWKARLLQKSVMKLLLGKYLFVDISACPEFDHAPKRWVG